MEAPRVAAVAILGVAAILLVPTFNALNEQRLGDWRPPVDLQDPPDMDPPPDFEPPPINTPPQCQPGEIVLDALRFEAPSGQPSHQRSYDAPLGTAEVYVAVGYESYRGTSSIVLTGPGGSFRDGTTMQQTLVNGRSGENGDSFPHSTGAWQLTVSNQGVTGGFGVVLAALGCFPAGGA